MHRVLIVEDDRMNARLFEVILKKMGGFRVVVSDAVQDVLRLAKGGDVDAILMDVSLSNCFYEGQPVDGLDICRLLKESPPTSHIPIILATAHSMQGDRERFLSSSRADDYVAKPVTDHRQLVQTIKGHIARMSGSEGDEPTATGNLEGRSDVVNKASKDQT